MKPKSFHIAESIGENCRREHQQRTMPRPPAALARVRGGLVRGLLLAVIGAASLMYGCSSRENMPGMMGGSQVVMNDGRDGGATCIFPATGCPCTEDGTSKDCGEVKEHVGADVMCLQGVRTCTRGVWGACVGQRTIKIHVPSAGSVLRLEALAGTSTSCNDLCSPQCQFYQDTPAGVDAGSNLTATDAGMSILGSGNCANIVVPDQTIVITNLTIPASRSAQPGVVMAATCGVAGPPVAVTQWRIDTANADIANITTSTGDLRITTPIARDITVYANTAMGTAHVKVQIPAADTTNCKNADFDSATSPPSDPGVLVYPYAYPFATALEKPVVFPLSMTAPLVQYNTGGTPANCIKTSLCYPAGSCNPQTNTSTNIFRWDRFINGSEGTDGNVDSTQPAVSLNQSAWNAFSNTAKGADADILVQRRRTAGSVIMSQMNGMPTTVHFATDSLRGTLFYTQYLRSFTTFGSGTVAGQTAISAAGYSVGDKCPIGNITHVSGAAASGTRAINLSKAGASPTDPFGGTSGCPVCHSISANGSSHVSGNQAWQSTPSGTSKGINRINITTGNPTFTPLGTTPNYSTLTSLVGWQELSNGGVTLDEYSWGFSYAPIGRDGSLLLQGPAFWGNTVNTLDELPASLRTFASENTANLWQDGVMRGVAGKKKPYFIASTTSTVANAVNIGGVGVQFATTAALPAYTVSTSTVTGIATVTATATATSTNTRTVTATATGTATATVTATATRTQTVSQTAATTAVTTSCTGGSYSCPISGGSACDGLHNCSKTAACTSSSLSCPTGSQYSCNGSNKCSAACTGSGTWSPHSSCNSGCVANRAACTDGTTVWYCGTGDGSVPGTCPVGGYPCNLMTHNTCRYQATNVIYACTASAYTCPLGSYACDSSHNCASTTSCTGGSYSCPLGSYTCDGSHNCTQTQSCNYTSPSTCPLGSYTCYSSSGNWICNSGATACSGGTCPLGAGYTCDSYDYCSIDTATGCGTGCASGYVCNTITGKCTNEYGTASATATATGTTTITATATGTATATVTASAYATQTVTGTATATATMISYASTLNGSGSLSVDGQTMAAGNAILVKNESNRAIHGVYSVTAASPWQLLRRTDADGSNEITTGMEVRVSDGSTNYGRVFRVSTTGIINVGTTLIDFTQMSMPTLPNMMTPAFSPDGTRLAFVNADADTIGGTSDTGWRRGLSMLRFGDATLASIASHSRLVNNWGASNTAMKWPFFEHDNHSLLFVETHANEYCSSDAVTGYCTVATDTYAGATCTHTATQSVNTDLERACFDAGWGSVSPSGRGFWPGTISSVDSDAPSSTYVQLQNLSGTDVVGAKNQAFQPTVLPFSAGGYRWVIFTSQRPYGNQINAPGTHFSCGSAMLWLAAVDDRAADGSDRSYPAFLVPGQSMAKITAASHPVNERGYIVPTLCTNVGNACSVTAECCSNSDPTNPTFCNSATGNCEVKTCQNLGETCSQDSDCCSSTPAPLCDPTLKICTTPPNYTTQYFTRDYYVDCAQVTGERGSHVVWGELLWHAQVDGGSNIGTIVFYGQSNGTGTFPQQVNQDPTVDPNAVLIATASSSADPSNTVNPGPYPTNMPLLGSWGAVVGTMNGYAGSFPTNDIPTDTHLRITMKFVPATGGTASPTLYDWNLTYSCVPAE